MSDPAPNEAERAFLVGVGALGPALLGMLAGLEAVARRLHPPEIPLLRQRLAPLRARLAEARAQFDAAPPPTGLEAVGRQLATSCDHASEAAALFCDEAPGPSGIERILGSMSRACRAQEAIFPLRDVFPSIGRAFVEPAFAGVTERSPEERTAPESAGLFTAHNDLAERGGFTLYVPETWHREDGWPLVVALHGGHGHGADFLWTWLREARGRGFLLLAPTSRGATWSLEDPRVDGAALSSMIDHVAGRWPLDRARILLTGLSDGGTFSLLAGLAEDAPFSAIAPVSGVLHPLHHALGNLERAAGRRIYLVHGAQDWMFPVTMAREAAALLERAGADLTYREIDDLSHTYPREENANILAWFDPALASPAQGP